MIVFNPKIAKEAMAFYEVGKRCYADSCKVAINKENYSILLPAVINLSFGIEIFLKACINPPIREHNLKKLLKAVPEQERNSIIQMTSLQMQRVNKNAFSEDQFWEELQDAKDAFEKWRYFYEAESNLKVNLMFLFSLATTLKVLSETVLATNKSNK